MTPSSDNIESTRLASTITLPLAITVCCSTVVMIVSGSLSVGRKFKASVRLRFSAYSGLGSELSPFSWPFEKLAVLAGVTSADMV